MCRICGRPGHWGNECPQRVQEVSAVGGGSDATRSQSGGQQQQNVTPSVVSTAIGSSVSANGAGTSATAYRGVRLVHLYDVSTPRGYISERALSEAESDTWKVRAVSCQFHFSVFHVPIFDAEDELVDVDSLEDGFYSWLASPIDCVDKYQFKDITDGVSGSKSQRDGGIHSLKVAAISSGQNSDGANFETVDEGDLDEQHIVLDSGADVSLLPLRYGHKGRSISSSVNSGMVLEDAQGCPLSCTEMKRASINVKCRLQKDDGDEFSICSVVEDFVVAKVTNVLLSMGRLLKNGWKFNANSKPNCVGTLISPDGQCLVDVHYKQNSLSLRGCIYKAIMVRPTFDVAKLQQGWQFLDRGLPVSKRTSRFVLDPRSTLPLNIWRYRTTVVQIGDSWEVVEQSRYIDGPEDLSEEIPGLLISTTVLTFTNRRPFDLSECQCAIEPSAFPGPIVMDNQRQGDVGEMDAYEGGDIFQPERGVPVELQDDLQPVMSERHDHEAGGHVKVPDVLTVNGKEIAVESTSNSLKEACKHLGISQGGSKTKLFERIGRFLQMQLPQQLDEAANRLNRQMQGPPVNLRRGVSVPSEEEVRRICRFGVVQY